MMPTASQVHVAPVAVTVQQLRKSFGGVQAVRGVSLDVRAGEVHALLGHNGAGKSTVVKMITGAVRPDGGTITIAGLRLDPTPAAALRLGVRCIYQQRTLFPNYTVAENVAMLSRPKLWHSAPRSRAIARERLARLGCQIDVDRIAATLSVGEAQEVDIARALDGRCRLLILDEPTSSLSAAEVTRLLAVVEQARSLGVGVLFISHELDVVMRIADRITVLRDGEVVASAPSRSLSKQEIVALMLGPAAETAPKTQTDTAGRPRRAAEDDRVRLQDVSGRRLGHLTLTLRAEEVTGVTGGLGSGIEDLARILGGAELPVSGTIELANQPAPPRSPRQALRAGMTYISDDRDRAGLFENLLPIHQIGLSRMTLSRRQLIRPAEEAAQALALCAAVGLSERDARRPVTSLSGGNRQKVLLARCLATRPSVVVAHEPTMGVDVASRAAVHALLRALAAGGAAVIIVSSDASEIIEAADRAIVLRGGTLALDTYEFNEAALVDASLGAHRQSKRREATWPAD